MGWCGEWRAEYIVRQQCNDFVKHQANLCEETIEGTQSCNRRVIQFRAKELPHAVGKACLARPFWPEHPCCIAGNPAKSPLHVINNILTKHHWQRWHGSDSRYLVACQRVHWQPQTALPRCPGAAVSARAGALSAVTALPWRPAAELPGGQWQLLLQLHQDSCLSLHCLSWHLPPASLACSISAPHKSAVKSIVEAAILTCQWCYQLQQLQCISAQTTQTKNRVKTK